MPQSKIDRLATMISSFKKPNLLAFLICCAVFIAWSYFLIGKFTHFGYYDWDLAIYANAMWALTQGSFSGSLWGTNFLTNHAEYISILLAPLYGLFPSALTLITLKLLSVIAGGYVLYLIAKAKLGWKLGLTIMILYFIFPANCFMLIFEFHFESLAIVFLFLVYYYLRVRSDYGKFILYCFLASLCKENVPPVIFMFGFISLFEKEVSQKKFAWTAMGIGAGIFILGMFVIMPFLRHAEGLTNLSSPYIGLYWTAQENTSFIQNLTINSRKTLSILFSSLNFEYATAIFLPFLVVVPLFGFKTLLIGSPLLLQALLANTYSMHTIYYHYAATLTPFLFLATLEGLAWIRAHFSKRTILTLTLMLIFGLIANSCFYSADLRKEAAKWQDRDDPVRWALVQQIPPNAGVVSTFEFLSHLANRNDVYPLRNIWKNSNVFKYPSAFIPPQTPYTLINWDCDWLYSEVLEQTDIKIRQESLMNLKNFYFQNNWQVKAAIGEITLLEKKHGNLNQQRSLVEVQHNSFTSSVNNAAKNVNIDNEFQLLYSEVGTSSFENFSHPLTALTFYWKADSEITDIYIIDISLFNKNKPLRTWRHTIGYGVYATPIWQNGDYIKETYWIAPGPLPDGEYSIGITIGNLTQNRWAPMEYQAKDVKQIQIGSLTIRSSREDIVHEK